jgi:HSP20 family protein
MTLVRWNPVRDVTAWHPVSDMANEFLNMQREMDRVSDRFRGGKHEDSENSLFLPAVDISEHAEAYEVKVELPGVNKNDVKITVHNDVLTISGVKKQEGVKIGKNFHRVERSYGSFQRSFTLPSSVKGEKIEAVYNDGVLTVTLPKVEEAKPKEIEVKVK